MLASLATWWARRAKEDSTIAGLSTLAIVAAGVSTGTMPWQVAANLAVGAVLAVLLPGHPPAAAAVSKAASDAIAALDATQRIRAIGALQEDLPKAIEAVVRGG